MNKKEISVIITDLDNTLYDWFRIWYLCFRPMLDEIVRISGIPEERIIEEIRTINQKYGTAEYAFLIEELPSIRQKHGKDCIHEIYRSAIDAYRKNRRKYLRLYPKVMDTLNSLKEKGCLIVAYTESKEFYTNYRIRKLGLDGVIDIIYSPKDHKLPRNLKRKYPLETYCLTRTIQRHIPDNEYKPNPKILLDIIKDIGVPKDEVIYVGDSLTKDISMAQNARVLDVHAEYGESHRKREYDLLRSVTHWTKEQVEKEKVTRKEDVVPSITLKRDFSEMLKHFSFKSFKRAKKPDKDQMRNILEIWKTTINVQMHFNELEMKIRNYAITVVGAILSIMVLLFKNTDYASVFRLNIPAPALIIAIPTIVLLAFYFMDRYWYHKLLLGSVKHAEKIEESLSNIVPEMALTKTISKASPSRGLGLEIHSSKKITIFYVILLLGFVVIALAFYFAHPRTISTQTTGTTNTTDTTNVYR